MAFDPATGLIDLATTVVNKIWPDKTEQEKAELAGALALVQGQLDVNKQEATSTNWFVAGWRPAIGWVGAISLFVYYVPYCIVATYIWAHQVWITGQLTSRPDLGIMDLIGLISSMLGVATLRTFEKLNNAEGNR